MKNFDLKLESAPLSYGLGIFKTTVTVFYYHTFQRANNIYKITVEFVFDWDMVYKKEPFKCNRSFAWLFHMLNILLHEIFSQLWHFRDVVMCVFFHLCCFENLFMIKLTICKQGLVKITLSDDNIYESYCLITRTT